MFRKISIALERNADELAHGRRGGVGLTRASSLSDWG